MTSTPLRLITMKVGIMKTRFLLRTVGFHKTISLMARMPRQRSLSEPDPRWRGEIAWAARSPLGGTCLDRSVLLWFLMNRHSLHGKIRIGNNTFSSNPPELAKTPLDSLKFHLPVSNNHMQNLFDCIKSREKPIANVEIGHRSAILCHLGNIARWVGRRLKWDPVKEIFPGDDEANAYLDRPRRKGYELPEKV